MVDLFGPAPFRYRNILVVDDEPDVGHALKDLLETSFDGLQVNAATSGQEGLEILREKGADLIITDYRMPRMNGLQFLAEARKIREGVPHIILTAFDREILQKLGPRGAVKERILQKPMDPEAMLDEVKHALDAAPSP